MEYKTEITQEDIQVDLRDKNGDAFASFKIDSDKEVMDFTLTDKDGDELISGNDFGEVDKFNEWANDTIERIKAVQKEVNKLVPPKPKKPIAKKKK